MLVTSLFTQAVQTEGVYTGVAHTVCTKTTLV